MVDLLKAFGRGILYILCFPFFLVALAIFAVIGLLAFIFQLIKSIIYFFTGQKFFPELPEDKELRLMREAEQARNNPQPQPTNDNNTQTNPQPQQNNPPQNNPSDQSSEPNIDPTEFKNVMAARYAKVNNKSEADEVYNSLKSELINAYNWYLKKRYDPAVSPPMKNRYGTQIKTIESLQKQNKIVYKDCINNLQPTDNQTQPTSQPQQNNPSQNNQPLTEEQKATIEQLKAYSWKPPTPPSGGDLWSYIDSLSFDTAANYVKPMLADIDKKLDYLNNYKTDDPQIESVVNNKKSWLRKMGDQLVFSVNDLHKDTDKSPLLNNPYNSKSQPINS